MTETTKPIDSPGGPGEWVLLGYRTPAESVRTLVPPGLELMTRGPWAYWNVMAWPADGDRHTVAYRLYVQAMTDRIDVVRGLYVVETGCDARLVMADHPSPHPAGSSFTMATTAAAWLTCPPLLLAVEGRDVRCVEVAPHPAVWRPRNNPRPVTVIEAALPYLESLGQTELFLEHAVRVTGVDVRWRPGRRLPLLQPGTRGVIDTLAVRPRRREAAVLTSPPEPVSV